MSEPKTKGVEYVLNGSVLCNGAYCMCAGVLLPVRSEGIHELKMWFSCWDNVEPQ